MGTANRSRQKDVPLTISFTVTPGYTILARSPLKKRKQSFREPLPTDAAPRPSRLSSHPHNLHGPGMFTTLVLPAENTGGGGGDDRCQMS